MKARDSVASLTSALGVSSTSYSCIKGVSGLLLSSVDTSGLDFRLEQKSGPNLDTQLRCDGSDELVVGCSIRQDFLKGSSAQEKSLALAFQQVHREVTCKRVEAKVVKIERLGLLVHDLAWSFGRVSFVAKELAKLEQRYTTEIRNDPEGSDSDVLVRVVLGKNLEATFELHATYPFGPLSVTIVDGDGLEKVSMYKKRLARNARPGFGQLSRACDLLCAAASS